MLTPSYGIDGVKKFILDTVRTAGPNPCPPIVVGVGIGGTFRDALSLLKKLHSEPLILTMPMKDTQNLRTNCSKA